jgi:hypothetical protein
MVASCLPPPVVAEPPLDAPLTPLPAWAIHIAAPQSLTPESTPEQIETLRHELLEPALRAGTPYTSPEQIAAMAAAELSHGHEWDAALLLAIASFRYRQQADLAVALGNLDVQARRPDTEQTWLVRKLEKERLWRNDFGPELRAIRRRLRKTPSSSTATVSVATPPDAGLVTPFPLFGLEQMNVPIPSIGSRPEELTYPQLANAFLARLEADNRSGQVDRFIEMVPLIAFRRAGLRRLRNYLMPQLLPDVTAQANALRPISWPCLGMPNRNRARTLRFCWARAYRARPSKP